MAPYVETVADEGYIWGFESMEEFQMTICYS